MGLISKLRPVYSWEKSPPVFALMVPTHAALEEMNGYGSAVTEGELARALRDCGIETSDAGERLKAEIKAFYDARKDRRLARGVYPLRQCEIGPLISAGLRVAYADIFGLDVWIYLDRDFVRLSGYPSRIGHGAPFWAAGTRHH